VTIQEFLKTVPLFHELSDEDLAQILMVGLTRRYPAGTTILSEGTPGGQLHIIHQGEVRISKLVPGAGEEALTILGPADLFGEVEMFDQSPCSASAFAHTDCEIFSIPHREVQALIRAHPELAARFLWAFGRTLASRLREMNQKIAALFAMSRVF
jgi:CRP-like cAMP-binding protein